LRPRRRKTEPERSLKPKEEAALKCPFCRVPLTREHRRNCPALREVGSLVSLEDYAQFQRAEATATDLESTIMLERLIGRGEAPRRGESKIMLYVMALVIGIIGVGIGLYMLKTLGVIP